MRVYNPTKVLLEREFTDTVSPLIPETHAFQYGPRRSFSVRVEDLWELIDRVDVSKRKG